MLKRSVDYFWRDQRSPIDIADEHRDDLAYPLMRRPAALPLLAALFIGLSTIIDPSVRDEAIREVVVIKLAMTAILGALTIGMLYVQRREPDRYVSAFAVIVKFVLASGICSLSAIGDQSLSTALTYVMIVLITPTYAFSSARMVVADLFSAAIPYVVLVAQSDVASGWRVRYLVTMAAGMIVALITSRYFARLRQDIESVRQDLLYQAMHDPITGLGNRVTWYQQTHRLLAARGSNPPGDVSMLYIDLDHFKRINDEFGHAVGDQALRTIGTSITTHLRPTDIVARIGGEEFVVLMPRFSVREATRTAGAIQDALAREHSLPMPLTASIGIALHLPGEAVDDFVNRADHAMLLAKQTGRNRFVIASVFPGASPGTSDRDDMRSGHGDDRVLTIAPALSPSNP